MTWILKHEDGQYLENVFAPDEAEPVCDFRDVPQRMAIRFGHRQAARDTRQTIHDRLGVWFRIVRLRPRSKALQARLHAAAVRTAKREVTVQGMGSAFSAALGFIDAGNVEGARAICSAGHMAFICHLRERVSHEPGGIKLRGDAVRGRGTEAVKVWCVQHRTGWCAARRNVKPKEGVNSVPTLCGFHITLPWGFKQRTPTCKECRAAQHKGDAGRDDNEGKGNG